MLSYTPKAFVQKPAPHFAKKAIIDQDIKDYSLTDLLEGGKKWGILFFYPLDFTFVCPTGLCFFCFFDLQHFFLDLQHFLTKKIINLEIIAFSDAIEEFKKRNCNVAAASCDSEYSHLAWVQTPRKQGGLGDMKIPVIEDFNKTMAKDYGVLVEEAGVALRGLFIISPKGIIRQITINDLPVGRSVEEALRLLEAFQFTDEHGEVCAAGWHPGQKGMKADPKLSKEYFKSTY